MSDAGELDAGDVAGRLDNRRPLARFEEIRNAGDVADFIAARIRANATTPPATPASAAELDAGELDAQKDARALFLMQSMRAARALTWKPAADVDADRAAGELAGVVDVAELAIERALWARERGRVRRERLRLAIQRRVLARELARSRRLRAALTRAAAEIAAALDELS